MKGLVLNRHLAQKRRQISNNCNSGDRAPWEQVEVVKQGGEVSLEGVTPEQNFDYALEYGGGGKKAEGLALPGMELRNSNTF